MILGILLSFIFLALGPLKHVVGAASGNMFGLITKEAVLLTTTSTFHGPSGVLMQSDMNWITPLAGNQTLLGLRGDPSDCDFLRGQLELVCNEHTLNFNGRPLCCSAVANYCRHVISKHLRSSKPLRVEVLIAGWDAVADKPALYWLDEVGAMQHASYAAHGTEFPFIFSFLDRAIGTSSKSVKLGMREGIEAIRSCWKIINKRTSGYGTVDDSIIKIYAATSKGVQTLTQNFSE